MSTWYKNQEKNGDRSVSQNRTWGVELKKKVKYNHTLYNDVDDTVDWQTSNQYRRSDHCWGQSRDISCSQNKDKNDQHFCTQANQVSIIPYSQNIGSNVHKKDKSDLSNTKRKYDQDNDKFDKMVYMIMELKRDSCEKVDNIENLHWQNEDQKRKLNDIKYMNEELREKLISLEKEKENNRLKEILELNQGLKRKIEELEKEKNENLGALHEEKEKAKKDIDCLEKKNNLLMDKIQFLEKRNQDNSAEYIKVIDNLKEKISKIEQEKEIFIATHNKHTKPSDEISKHFQRDLVDSFFKNLMKSSDFGKKSIVICLPFNFRLQTFFEENSNSHEDKTFLFRELNNRGDNNFHARKMLADWKIYFGVTISGLKKRMNAEEYGSGTSAEFFSQVYEQMGNLKVSVATEEGVKCVCLFERCSVGVIPTTNDRFLTNDDETSCLLQRKARIYYRAIGRLMFRSLFESRLISPMTMPTFFRNIIFRGFCIEDTKEHHQKDILDQLHEIDFRVNPKDWIGTKVGLILGNGSEEIVSKEVIFKTIIPEYFVKSRSLAINALIDGLTLNGFVNVQSLFHNIPLDVFSSLVFSKPYVKFLNLERILKPEYSNNDLEKKQEFFYNEIFLKVLKKLEDESDKRKQYDDDREGFLSLFLRFCTGQQYLPNQESDPTFAIIVNFNTDNTMTKESLPRVYTCYNEIQLPQCVYNLNAKVFEEKLLLAIESSKGVFTMSQSLSLML